MSISGCGVPQIWRRGPAGEVSQRLIWPLASGPLQEQRGGMDGLPRRDDRVVVIIGAFKLVKSALLIAIGVGWLVGSAAGASSVRAAAAWTGALSENHVVRRAVERLAALDGHGRRQFAIAALCYAAVFVVEGVGLLRRRRW